METLRVAGVTYIPCNSVAFLLYPLYSLKQIRVNYKRVRPFLIATKSMLFITNSSFSAL